MKENVSTVFLLPGIKIKAELKNEFYTHGFMNTFLSCPPLDYPFEVIYLLFKPSVVDHDFICFANELQKNQNFVETIDAGKGKVLMVYRIPKEFKRDYALFLEGKYSKLSQAYKECFQMEQFKLDANGKPVKEGLKYIKEPTTFYHIFHRTDDIKALWAERLGYEPHDTILDNIELYDKIDEEKETLMEELWLG